MKYNNEKWKAKILNKKNVRWKVKKEKEKGKKGKKEKGEIADFRLKSIHPSKKVSWPPTKYFLFRIPSHVDIYGWIKHTLQRSCITLCGIFFMTAPLNSWTLKCKFQTLCLCHYVLCHVRGPELEAV